MSDQVADGEEVMTGQPASPFGDEPAAPQQQQAKPGKAMREFQEREDADILDWLTSLTGGNSAIRVEVNRLEPLHVRIPGRAPLQVGGYVKTYDRPISLEQIEQEVGGGKLELRVKRPDSKGRWVYFKNRTVVVAGPPSIKQWLEKEEEEMPAPSAPAHDASTTKMAELALTAMKDHVNLVQAQADEGAGKTEKVIELAQKPLISALEQEREDRRQERAEHQRTLTEMKNELKELARAPASDGAITRLLETMVNNSDERMSALRIQFDSERNALNTYWQGQLARVQDSAERQVAAIEKAHDKALTSAEKSHERELKQTEMAKDSIIDSLKRELERANREMTALERELGELRAKKDKPFVEQLREIQAVKEMLTPEQDEDDDKGMMGNIAGVADVILNSKLAQGIAGRVASGGPQPPQQQAQPQQQEDPAAKFWAELPVGKRVKLADGRIVAKQADGRIAVVQSAKGRVAVPAAAKQEAAAAQAAGGASAQPAQPAPEEQQITVDPAQVAMAVTFLENALSSGKSAEEVAQSVGPMMPPSLIGAIKKRGIDAVLAVANISDSSPLLTSRGKDFLKKIAASLG